VISKSTVHAARGKIYTRKKGDEDDERTKDIWKDLNVHSVDSSNIYKPYT